LILFGPLHLSLIGAIFAIAAILSWLCRRATLPLKPTRLILGIALAGNEIVWWIYRYSIEGFHLWNLPLQLCDASVWLAVVACLVASPLTIELGYFLGIAGAGMALVTPNLISPWPSYAAIYFFAAHGGIVICVAVMVFGSGARFRPFAVWRAFAFLLAYAAFVGLVDWASGSNYMFLRHKPEAASALDQMGPWPWYLAAGAAAGLALFWLIWLPVRYRGNSRSIED
jgi:hypothetical integral membrane protein (TIGR02206 family)